MTDSTSRSPSRRSIRVAARSAAARRAERGRGARGAGRGASAGAVMDRLSPLDASFLHIEEGNNHMHIGSLTIFEGPAPAYDELLALIMSKLPNVPRYRQMVRFVPLALGQPVWVDDPHFNLAYHVRHSALPAPGDEDQLRRMAGRVM